MYSVTLSAPQALPTLEHTSTLGALTSVSCPDRPIPASEVDLNELSTSASSTCSRPDQVIPALQPLEERSTKPRTIEKSSSPNANLWRQPLPDFKIGSTTAERPPPLAHCVGFGLGQAKVSAKRTTSSPNKQEESADESTMDSIQWVFDNLGTITSNRVTTSTRTPYENPTNDIALPETQ